MPLTRLKFRRLVVPAVLASVALFSSASVQAQVVAITHPGVKLNIDEIHDVFVGDKQVAGGTKLVPVDNAAMQDQFLSKVVKVDAAKYANIWTKKSFREGLSPPAVKSSDSEVGDYVRRTPGAVGYVRVAPAGVNVVQP